MNNPSPKQSGYAVTKKAIGEHLNISTGRMEPRHEVGAWVETKHPEICGACFRSIPIGQMAVLDISKSTVYCENCVIPADSLSQALTMECVQGELPRIQVRSNQQAKADFLRTGHYHGSLITPSLEKAFQKNKKK